MERKEQHPSEKRSPEGCAGCLLCKGIGSWYTDPRKTGGRSARRGAARLGSNRRAPRLWVS